MMTRMNPNTSDDQATVWDSCVSAVLRKMPVYTTQEEKAQHIELRRNEALQLAAAALRAAGEYSLAENLLD
ncbi:hypothetical protein ACS6GF_09960 [Enterobacter cloacae]|uniref:hypothetical protein n=1 Tax=Enterobacter cloacae TaxID=550 RepID=UPI003F440062